MNRWQFAIRLTTDDRAAGFVRMLDFAQRYSVAIEWSTQDRAERMLRATGAFDEDPAAARMRLPDPRD